jgi:small subunit ribosomal protein S9
MNKRIITSGKRKSAVARAVLTEGTGKVTVNKRNYMTLDLFDRLKIEEPLRISENVLGKMNFDISVSVKGGGDKGQIEAARLAIARGIVEFSKSNAKAKSSETSEAKELEKAFSDYDWSLLVADVRRKEAYKPGDSKARAKRQKSFR